MSCFQSVDITLVLDDSKGANQRKCFSLFDIDDDQESLYQLRAKEWFPFGLTLDVPGSDLPQKVQVLQRKEKACVNRDTCSCLCLCCSSLHVLILLCLCLRTMLVCAVCVNQSLVSVTLTIFSDGNFYLTVISMNGRHSKNPKIRDKCMAVRHR